jgi:REP element-mobilizing transposase RayT
MARSLRIERSNAVYHIINRGNYQQDLFINEGAHKAFERCLFEACEKCGWILEGHCVMTNHFHLVIRTPQGNLSYGMKWLQATFANRYHRFRKVHGKLFQGRFKSLIVEEDAYLGALQHYVHLNPVRAGICSLDELKGYRWSSYWYLWHPSKRPGFMDITGALDHAGGLKDTPAGRRSYRAYLDWLSTDSPAQKEMAFDRMCLGWALGTKAFKKELLKTEGLLGEGSFEALKLEGRELHEANELQWNRMVEQMLSELGKDEEAIRMDKKSTRWKVWMANVLKSHSSATNVWIAKRLEMGAAQSVSILTSRLKKELNEHSDPAYEQFYQNITK